MAHRYLKRAIQQGKEGHDSIEDAQTALDLVKLKMAKGLAYGQYEDQLESVIPVLNKFEKNVHLIDRADLLGRQGVTSQFATPVTSDAEVQKIANF